MLRLLDFYLLKISTIPQFMIPGMLFSKAIKGSWI